MRLPFIAVAALLTACQPDTAWQGSIDKLLESQPDRFGDVLSDPEKHRIQIIYTQIDRNAENEPTFRSFTYRVDPGEYFYPASTVKLPTAVLSLQRLKQLDRRGLDRDSVMLTGTAADYQTEAIDDDTSPTGLPSIGQYIRKILLVSDNDAFNRLYEFLGQEPLNLALQRKGFANTRIIHRLEIALGVEENQLTNPVRFIRGDETVYVQPAQQSGVSFVGPQPELLGKAEIVDGERLERPKDFAEKNAYALEDLHDTVKAIMFPDSVEPAGRFDLDNGDYEFLWRYMSMYPGESGIGAYSDPLVYPDGYVKFLMFGGDAEEIPANIRIFNKVGDAYGFLTDAAYVVDFDAGLEFLLAATVYTNANETFNDNEYEYDELGLPFLRELGQAIYEVELERERAHSPDLAHLRALHGAE